MNWQTILKQPKLRTGSKITTNLGTDSKLEDNDCLKKVLEYLDKMRGVFPLEIIDNDYDLSYAPGVKKAIDEFTSNNNFNSRIISNNRFAIIEKN